MVDTNPKLDEEKLSDYDKLVLDLIKERFQLETDRDQGLRDRSSNFIQVNLVFLGIVVAIMALMVQGHVEFTSSRIVTLIAVFVLSFGSIFQCVRVIWPTQIGIVDIFYIDKKFGNHSLSFKVGTIFKGSRRIVKQINESNLNKGDYLRTSIIFFIGAIVGIFLFALALAM